jgi:polyisoprenoid-binding protein YceI
VSRRREPESIVESRRLCPEPGQAGATTVRVTDSAGWPVGSAVVTLVDHTGSQAARVVADRAGVAVVAGVAAGSYTMIVTAPGSHPLARTLRVGAADAVVDAGLAGSSGTALPQPGIWDIDPIHSSIQVTTRHLGISAIHGRVAEFSGSAVIADPIERSRVDALMRAATLDTGNADRDAHLRSVDFLDTANYPNITFAGSGLVRLGPDTWGIDGRLTIRATTRPVRLHTSYLGTGPDPWGGERAGFNATAELSRDEFAVDWNQAVRIGVAAVSTTVKITLDIELVRRA